MEEPNAGSLSWALEAEILESPRSDPSVNMERS